MNSAALSIFVLIGLFISWMACATTKCKLGGYTCDCETVESTTRVRCISIREPFLKKLEPESSQNITVVRLDNNLIQWVPDGVFDSLNATLENLTLSHNRLERTPTSILTLSKLVEMKLDFNLIFEVKNNTFQGLTQLRRIDMDNNNIETIEDEAFEGLNLLTTLELRGNRLTNIPTQTLSRLKSLEMLTISYNFIRLIPANAFKGNTRLRKIDLSHNELGIKPIPIDAFAGLECSLEVLNMGLNYLTEVPSEALNRLESLKTLYLYNNRFTLVRDYAFSNLTSLMELLLQDGYIINIETKAFVGLENTLLKVNIRTNRIVSIDSCIINSLTNLTTFIFAYNRIPCNCSYTWLSKWLTKSYDQNWCLVDRDVSVTGFKNWEGFLHTCPTGVEANCSRDHVTQPTPTCTQPTGAKVPHESAIQITNTVVTQTINLPQPSLAATLEPTQTISPTSTKETSGPASMIVSSTSVPSSLGPTPVLPSAPTPSLTTMLTSEPTPALTNTSTLTKSLSTSVLLAVSVPTISQTPVSTVPLSSILMSSTPTSWNNETGPVKVNNANNPQKTGMIAGIVISLLVVAILVGFGIYFVIFKRKAGVWRSWHRSRGYRETTPIVLDME